MRDSHHVNLDDIREIERRLKATPDAEWSTLTIYVGEDGQVYFEDPSTKTPVAVSPLGQISLFPMRLIILQVEKQLVLLNRRTKGQIGRVTNNRYVMHNASIVAGTRIPTSAVFDLYHSGFSIEQIIIEYPRLTEKDVRAAINWEQIRVAS